MFRKDKAKIACFINSQSEFRGEFVIRGVLRMDGLVNGTVRADQVVLSETGALKGDVQAGKIIVAGSIEGTIRATDLVEIRSKGKVTGDIFTKKLSVFEGAEFNGNIVMGAEESGPQEFESENETTDQPTETPRLAHGEAGVSRQRPAWPFRNMAWSNRQHNHLPACAGLRLNSLSTFSTAPADRLRCA